MSLRAALGSLARPLIESVLAAGVGFLFAAVLLVVLGFNPVVALSALLTGSVGSVDEISVTLGNASPLILTALTFAVGIRAGIFNIGAEGQLYVGAAAAISVGLIPMPSGLHLFVAAAAAGLAAGFCSCSNISSP